jgi:hypothetical protein
VNGPRISNGPSAQIVTITGTSDPIGSIPYGSYGSYGSTGWSRIRRRGGGAVRPPAAATGSAAG